MLHEFSFLSDNGRDQVQAWIYVPACQPKGIIQIVHGFGEHSRRYFHMIVRFMEAGYIVAADDHVGHGKTAAVGNTWGDYGPDAKPFTMADDEKKLMDIAKEKYPGLPYFFFGHSMGSMITRGVMCQYGDELAGVTLCGTPGARFGGDNIARLTALCEEGKGNEPQQGGLGDAKDGPMFSRIEEGVTIGNEWICHDPYVQRDHADDPFDGFYKSPTTNHSALVMAQFGQMIQGLEWAEKVPKTLPVYNIGGDEDPVTGFGEGTYQVSNWLIDTGHAVRTKVYSGYRHEIHNYADIKDEVCDGIIAFFDGCL